MNHPNEDIARAVRRAADLLIERSLADADREKIRELAGALVEALEAGQPVSVRERTQSFVTQMAVHDRTEAIAEGEVFASFIESPYSGSINALAPPRVTYRRAGDTLRASILLGTALEGRPGRAHGGAVAALFDDAMGALQHIIGRNGYTQSLTTDYRAPFPTDVEVVMDVTCTEIDGPRFTIEGTASVGDQLIATATGVFTEIDVERWSRH